MIQTAVSGAENYVEAGETENEVMQETVDYIDSVVASIKGEDTSGGSNEGEAISTDTTYIGYYADTNGDGNVDGIIYADLVQAGSGTWNDNSWSSFSYDAESGLKEYYILEDTYEDTYFGERKVIKAKSGTTGNDRFYVMALEDVDSDYHCWYAKAYASLSSNNNVSTSANDFGSGKSNTGRMITSWNSGEYGTGNTGSYTDMWGLDAVQTGYTNGWFVPSKSEWSAFGYTFSLTSGDYGDYGLSGSYWSSSQ